MMVSVMKRVLKFGLLVASVFNLSLTLATAGIEFNRQGSMNSDLVFGERTTDLKVKSMIGNISVTRAFEHGGWNFFTQYNNLKFVLDSKGRIKEIYSGTSLFQPASGSQSLFRIGKQNWISKTNDGWKRENTDGEWFAYDKQGRVSGFGNRLKASVKIERDSTGKIKRFIDSFSTVLISVDYKNGLPSSVSDFTGRTVKYDWSGNLLQKVTDVLGEEWKYEYKSYSAPKNSNLAKHSKKATLSLIAKRYEPNGRTVTFKHGYTGGGSYCVRWGGDKCVSSVPTYPALILKSISDNAYGSESLLGEYSYMYDPVRKNYIFTEKKPNGLVTKSVKNSKGNTVQITWNKQTLSKTAYLNNGSSVVSQDATGGTTERDFDNWDNVLKKSLPNGSTEEYEYKPGTTLRTKYKSADGKVIRFEYDENSWLKKKVEAEGTDLERITVYKSNVHGLPKSKTIYYAKTPDENVTVRYEYDNFGNKLVEHKPSGKVTYANYNSLGQPGVVRSADGEESFHYDAAGNIKKKVSHTGAERVYGYNSIGQMILETVKTDVSSASPKESSTRYKYNLRGDFIGSELPFGGKTKMTRKNDDLEIRDKLATGEVLTLKKDLLGRVISSEDRTGKTEYVFGESGRDAHLSEPTKAITERAIFTEEKIGPNQIEFTVTSKSDKTKKLSSKEKRDATGRLIEIENEIGQVTKFLYDDLGRTVAEVNKNTGYTHSFEYDSFNKVTKVVNGMGVALRRFDYQNNQLKKEIFSNGNFIEYSYYDDGRIKTKKYPSGDSEEHVYSGRLHKDILYRVKDGKSVVRKESFTYNDNGQVSNVRMFENGKELLSYDFSFVNQKIEEITIKYFDANSGSYLFSKSIKYGYGKSGKLAKFTEVSSGQETVYTYTAGKEIVTLPVGDIKFSNYLEGEDNVAQHVVFPNGVVTDYTYDDFLFLDEINVSKGKNVVMRRKYAVNGVGYPSEVDTESGKFKFSYDRFSNLASYQVPQGLGLMNEFFTVDKSGNRLTDSNLSNRKSWTYKNEQIETAGDIRFEHDKNGNIVKSIELTSSGKKVVTRYAYSPMQHLFKVTRDNVVLQENRYDYRGRRISKKENGKTTYFFYGDRGLVAEYDETGELTTGYVLRSNLKYSVEPIAIYKKKPSGAYEYYFYHTDMLGTPQKITDKDGDVVWSAYYKAFGEALLNVAQIENNIRLPGQYYDASTGLHYNYYRTYDAKLGRYLQRDPLGYNGDVNSDYVYAFAAPNVYVDPKGGGGRKSKGPGAFAPFCEGSGKTECKCENKNQACFKYTYPDSSDGTLDNKGSCKRATKPKNDNDKLPSCELSVSATVGVGALFDIKTKKSGKKTCVTVKGCLNAKVGLSAVAKCKLAKKGLGFGIAKFKDTFILSGPTCFNDLGIELGCKKIVAFSACNDEVGGGAEANCSAGGCGKRTCCSCDP